MGPRHKGEGGGKIGARGAAEGKGRGSDPSARSLAKIQRLASCGAALAGRGRLFVGAGRKLRARRSGDYARSLRTPGVLGANGRKKGIKLVLCLALSNKDKISLID